MRARFWISLMSVLMVSLNGAYGEEEELSVESPSTNESPSEIFSQEDTKEVSRALGHLVYQSLNIPGLDIQLDSVIQGMKESASGQQAPMSMEEYDALMASLEERAYDFLANTNLSAAQEFLEENVQKESVIEVVPGRLQYEVLSTGEGPEVGEHSSPTIHYTGTYIDGTIFGSSQDGNGPITLSLDQTIPGFQKGISGMCEGEKRRIFVHPELGYGTSGHLPPNSLLIFDIEVLASENSENEAQQEESAIVEVSEETEETI